MSDTNDGTDSGYWRYDTPPRGRKIFMLNAGGIPIVGKWAEAAGHIAWHDLFKRNKDIEKTMGVKDTPEHY